MTVGIDTKPTLVACPAFVRFVKDQFKSWGSTDSYNGWLPPGANSGKPLPKWFSDVTSSADESPVPLLEILPWVCQQVPGLKATALNASSWSCLRNELAAALVGAPQQLLVIDSRVADSSREARIYFVGNAHFDLLPHRRLTDLTELRTRLLQINPLGLLWNREVFLARSESWPEPRGTGQWFNVTSEIAAAARSHFQLEIKKELSRLDESLWKGHVERHATKRLNSAHLLAVADMQRQALRKLLERPFDLPLPDAWIPLALNAALDSALLPLPLLEGDTIDVVSNLGAGHLLRIHVLSFAAEHPRPLRRWLRRDSNDWDKLIVLDGGDVVVILDQSKARILEGSSLHACAARTSATLGSDDDDDDVAPTSSGSDDQEMCDDYSNHALEP